MIEIPNTTLCCIDCDNYSLALGAMNHSSQLCHFDRLLFLTDKEFDLEGIDVVTIPSIKSREHYSLFVIKELANYIETDFVLLIQYDGFIINPDAWTPEFQEYDYIGAKWWRCTDGHNVGNGGFSLRSKRLLHLLSKENISFDPESLKKGEDHFICRTYRGSIESRFGIRFASETIADKFSYECCQPAGNPFGFHGLFNMWRYIKTEDLDSFVALLSQKSLSSIQALKLGINYQKLRQFKQAEIVYERILQCFPNNTAAAMLLGMSHKRVVPTI